MGNHSNTHVGHWKWDAGDRRLEIEPSPQSTLDELGGNWTLDSLGVLLDGLSRSRLERALDPSRRHEPRFACVLGLSNGGAIRPVFGEDHEMRHG